MVKKMFEPEPQIFNKPVLKKVDEDCIKIHLDLNQLRNHLPKTYYMFRETVKNIVKHHRGHADVVAELRRTGAIFGDTAIESIHKFLISNIEITLYDVEKEWNGFDWEVKSFRGLKVEKVMKVM
jgi:hypothetical protein